MKSATVFAVAGLVAAGLASAIPTHGHAEFYEKKHDDIEPVIETVTSIFYQTVVWVDGNGVPVSTEVNTPPPGVPKSIETLASSEVSAAATPADLGAMRRPNGGQPQLQAQQSAAPPLPASSAAKNNAPAPVTSDTNKPVQQSIPVSQNTGTSGNTGGDTLSQSSAAVAGGMGIAYDMQASSGCKPSATINQEFSFLKSHGFGIVRIYDIGCPVGEFVAAAAQNGLKLIIGINSIRNLQADLGTLIGMVNGNWGSVDTVSICNECVNTGAASAHDVANAVTTAREILGKNGFHGSVVTVDTFNVMMNDATICSTSDYCATNIHPFFDKYTSADKAGGFVHNMYNKVASANSGKRIVITESGWPWQGQCNGQACPSVANQVTAVNSIVSQFAGPPSNLFLFQGYNAGYKSGGEYGVEPFWGIFDADHWNGGIS